MLASGTQNNLRRFLDARSIKVQASIHTRQLDKKIKDADLLTENGKTHFEDIAESETISRTICMDYSAKNWMKHYYRGKC